MNLLRILVGCALAIPTMAATRFERAFAPSDGLVIPAEKPFRDEICLNGSWQFAPMAVPGGFRRDQGEAPALATPTAWETTPIKIPCPWNVNAWGSGPDAGPGTGHPYWPSSVYYPSYPATWMNAEIGWLRRRFSVPADWVGQRIVLHFEAVAGDCRVLVNGLEAGTHFDSYLPFEVDVTKLVKTGEGNEVMVGVRHHRLFDQMSVTFPKFRATYPPGSETEKLVGIWQDVYLLKRPVVAVGDVYVQPLMDRDLLQVEVTVGNDSAKAREVEVGGDVRSWINLAGKDVLNAPEPNWRLDEPVLNFEKRRVRVGAGERTTVMLSVKPGGKLAAWRPGSPSLYMIIIAVGEEGRSLDLKGTRFGWRQVSIRGKDLLLNGVKIQLFGDLSHPFGPFMMSRRFAWAWYKMIQDFGGNAVRPHAQPYPRAYLEMADEMGILVLDETALFGSSVQLNFESAIAWERYAGHFDDLVVRDRNHPSVLGWSVGNELFAIFEQNRIEGDVAAGYYAKLAEIGNRARKLDPTRDWISCDGDEDLRGRLPVWSRHLGHGLGKVAVSEKPRMVGESGGSYYATPGQLAAFNGDRAYENYAGRSEALGIDLYQNVMKLAKPDLAYFSPSEVVWFGLEHLPLGYSDLSRVPNGEDGVFFDAFVEGKPGMQLERIPPYVTTLNPGYDSTLPLYKPLGMFKAMKAGIAGSPSPFEHVLKEDAGVSAAAPTIERVEFGGDVSSALYKKLVSWGVPLGDTKGAMFLILEGHEPKEKADMVRSAGGTVLMMVDRGEAWLPAGVTLVDRRATQLWLGGADARFASMRASELYFAEEETGRDILKRGIGGDNVARGRVLLRAADCDWSLFNRMPEVTKCGATLLYQEMQKPNGAALVEFDEGGGKTVVCTIDFSEESEKRMRLGRAILARLGVKLGEPRSEWLLPVATVAKTAVEWRYVTAKPEKSWAAPGFADVGWKVGSAGFGTRVPNSKVGTTWTSEDIWLRRELNLPAGAPSDLKLLVHHDEDVEVLVNGKEIYRMSGFVGEYQAVALDATARGAFVRGRNVVAVHCHQTAGGQYVDVGLLDGAVPEAVNPAKGTKSRDLLLDGPGE